MTRFLAIIRRIFGWGTVFLFLGIFIFGMNIASKGSLQGFFAAFFALSPILYFIFTIISVAYIRKHGQFAGIHQEQSPITSFFRCLGHDLAAPFKNIGGFFSALFNKNAVGRKTLIGRFIEMVVMIVICAFGVLILM